MIRKTKHKIKKLTAAEKKAVWAPSEENAGAGWTAQGTGEPTRKYPTNRERDTTKRLDEELL